MRQTNSIDSDTGARRGEARDRKERYDARCEWFAIGYDREEFGRFTTFVYKFDRVDEICLFSWPNTFARRAGENRRRKKWHIKLIESGSVSVHRHHQTNKRNELKRSVRSLRCSHTQRANEWRRRAHTYKRYSFYFANKYVLCCTAMGFTSLFAIPVCCV